MRTLCVLAVLLLCGCNGPETTLPDLPGIAQRMRDVGDAITFSADSAARDISEARAAIQGVSVVIDDQSRILRQSVPAAAVATTLVKQTKVLGSEAIPKLDDALKEISAIQSQAHEIEASSAEIDQAAVGIDKIAKERDSERKRADELEARLKSSAHSTLMWLIVIGVILLAGSVFVAIKVDWKSGAAMAVGSLMLIGASTFVSDYLEYIKWGAAGLLVIAICIAGYWLWRYMRGFWQSGNVVEELRRELPAEKVTALFAEDGPVRRAVDAGQTRLFRKAVKKGEIVR